MSDLLELMTAPFTICVVLVGIHAYLGLHVIQRRVIFVDLALAQIAALGATFGFLFGMDPHGAGAYFFSLSFAIAGAAVFAMTRMRHERIPQEAIIGVVYAVALASAILVADRAPEGAEHIKESLVGIILWVRWPTILKTAGIYSLIGVLHFVFRKRFFQISLHPEQAFAEKRWIRFWDFLFYVTFAFVITSSVAVAGVLMVFSFLVIPAVIATLFASRIGPRLAIGWSVGIAACLIGMVGSFRFDLPSGPAVVASLGIALILAGLLYYVLYAENRRYALLKVSAGVILLVGMAVGLGIFFTSGSFVHIAHEHDWEVKGRPAAAAVTGDGFWQALEQECGHDAACQAGRLRQRSDWSELSAEGLSSADPDERERVVEVLEEFDDPRVVDLLGGAVTAESDPLIRFAEIRILAARGDRRAAGLAVELLGAGTPPLVRDEAHQLLLEMSGKEFGYDPFGDAAANGPALEKWRAWASSP